MNHRILIVGAGIAGLTLALALHARGARFLKIVERSRGLFESGSGINILPLATRELADLGLLEELEAASVQLDKLVYCTGDGVFVWSEPKGRSAGFLWPQLSISRARLHKILLRAVLERCGTPAIEVGAQVVDLDQREQHPTALCADGRRFPADIVIGADGIRSALRRILLPTNSFLRAVPTTVYRGSYCGDPLGNNRTMYIAGDGHSKFVVYPMLSGPGQQTLVNWAAAVPDRSDASHSLGNWNLVVLGESFAGNFQGWSFNGFRPTQAIERTKDVYAYPMVDIDPIPAWSNGRNVVLVGDAAHAMYPIGSNGATQSIVDASALAHALATSPDIPRAIARYEHDRKPSVQAIQQANRNQGPEVVIDIATDRRKQRGKLDDHTFPKEERAAIASKYAALTNVNRQSVNCRSPYQWRNL